MATPQPRPDPRRIPDVPDRELATETIEDLNLRIEMAELRVVRRDLEFRLHWEALQQRGKAVMVPSRWLLPALGTGASWLFWRLVRGRRRRHARHERAGRHDSTARAFHAHERDAAAGPAHEGGGGRPELGMLQLLTVLWGLMPTRVRGRLGPEVTQLLLGVIAGFLQGRKQQREEARQAQGAAAGSASDRDAAQDEAAAPSHGRRQGSRQDPR